MQGITYLPWLLCFQLLCCQLAFSQDTTDVGAEPVQLRLNLFQPGIECELRLSRNSTLLINPALGFGVVPQALNDWDYALIPVLETEYRYYYNFNKRSEKEKSIRGNSGNFLGWRLAGTTAPVADNLPVFIGMTAATGPFWGMQRVYSNNFSFAYNIGLAYFINEFGSSFIAPIGELSVGFRVFRGKQQE